MKTHAFTFLSFVMMMFFIAGCEQQDPVRAAEIRAESQLSKQIALKDLTTGMKFERPVNSSSIPKWSYFGKERLIKIERTSDDIVASINISMDGGDAYQLRQALEEKYSKEEERKIRFDCSMKDRKLTLFHDMKVWDTICVLRHASQVLTVSNVGPDNSQMIQDYYSFISLFYSTTVTLVDTELKSNAEAETANKKSALEKKKAIEEKINGDRKKKDL